ncbi:nodal modulator [Musa troglodytarum]|uniref:ATP citrate synthase n=1 Tax=Musa troglodytarum TaxID=320322 RepID=A0A9E7EIR9_9LILI|nr:nodal modulator [Musa troglodytarum]
MAIGGLVLGFLFALFASSAAADAIHGCGGFIEASSPLVKSRKPSGAKLDYSHIRVELCTVDGLVKEWTQCAPNGYYFIPVYDKGSFVLRVKGPDGWSWKPDNVNVIVDQDGCNANADINFLLTGFTLSGRLIGAVGGESCPIKDGGPSGVKVELLSMSDDLIASSLTSAIGGYSFTNIIPGNYRLHVTHPNLEVEVRGSTEVNIGFGNAVVDDVFFVRGYDLQGFVVAQGNPIVGVHMYLYSDDVLEVHCPEGAGNGPRHKSALCHAVSDEEGRFLFKSLPCAIVSIEHYHKQLPQKFQVTGFSIGGRVVDDFGAGVDSAKILVDGQLKTITDAQGYYKLDQVLPNMAKIEDIKVYYYDICGVVRTISPDSKAMVTLSHGPEHVKPQRKLIDENGSFCFEVPPGEYRLSALAVDSENSGLMFSPSYVDVKVNSPLHNVEFFQAQVNVHGNVFCKEKCSPNLFVSLVRVIGESVQERKTIALTHESCEFTFMKVFPGKYRLEVKHISSLAMPEEDTWCWNENFIDLDVGTEDMTGIVFVQRGYWINLISSHDTDAYILLPDSSHLDISIKKGPQKICIETPGEHELHFVNSCISFGSSSLKFNSLDPTPIYLTGKKYLLKGEIHIDSDLVQDAVDLSEHIVLDVFDRDGTSDTVSTRFSADKSCQRNIAVYEYSIWSDLGEDIIFSPRDTSTGQEKKILFYPRQRQVSVSVDGCQASIPPISGRVGLYIEGSVSPALDGVNIRITAMGSSSYVSLQKGDLAFETETGIDGSFTAGPLYDDISYKVEASKPGYHLKQVGPSSFTCEQLSQIVVHIHDEKESGELFPSVLLSLSGEDGYRNNSISSAGGTFSFVDLFPGSFYLRPLLKEYSFSPAAVAIELESGESKVVKFLATRVAYSVSLLSGQPKEGVYVEARSETKGYYEEAATDNMGNFRLRGLLPDTTYMVKIVAKDYLGVKTLERASPESIAVMVGSEDVRGLDFVVFEQPDITILSGHVEGNDIEDLQPHLSVEIRLASDPSKVESVFPLPLSFYFEVRDLPRSKHLVQLRSRFPSSSHRFQSEILEVDLEKQPQTHAGTNPSSVFPLIVRSVCYCSLYQHTKVEGFIPVSSGDGFFGIKHSAGWGTRVELSHPSPSLYLRSPNTLLSPRVIASPGWLLVRCRGDRSDPRRETPSVAGIINPGSEGFQKLFFGQEEIAIPVHSMIEAACSAHPTADVFINFASFRSAAASSMSALKQPTIRVVAIIAEGVPESDTKQLIAYARANNKVLIGPATVGGIQAGAFKIGDTAGTIDNIIQCKLYRPGSVGFVSKSGGMSNELYNTIARVTDGIYEGIAIGGDVFPGSTLSDHVLRFNNMPQVKMMVVLGELGGRDEYSLVEALRDGKVHKPVVAWVSGTCARLFKSEVQFGHAGAKSGGELESAQAKNQALREAGAVVPTSYEAFETAIKETFEKLVEEGKIAPVPDVEPPQIPEDLKYAIKSGKVRAPTHIISTISDDRGEEPCYAGVPMSSIIQHGYGVGDVISLLWFKRSLPRYCTQFIEICIMLCADHGPCVSGAHNTIVTARAGKDLVSSLVSGLLTIGPRFGGAIDDAARYFKDACDRGLTPYEFVEGMKKKGIRVPGIGHSTWNMLFKLAYTLSKANNLVLNVDGAIGSLFLDLLAGSGMFSKQEIDEIVEIGYLNGLFVLARSIGLIGHTFDQKRLKQPLYRHPWEDVLYTK